jgi:hypothetical protein
MEPDIITNCHHAVIRKYWKGTFDGRCSDV